jgi:hypothetical protein
MTNRLKPANIPALVISKASRVFIGASSIPCFPRCGMSMRITLAPSRELALEGIMRVAERGNWLAYAWICERTAPHLYALRSVSRVVEEDQQFEEPIPGEILAKHRQFYAEMLLEDQAKAQSQPAADFVEQINQTSGKQIGQ